MSFISNANGIEVPWYKSAPDPEKNNWIIGDFPSRSGGLVGPVSLFSYIPIYIWRDFIPTNFTFKRDYESLLTINVRPDNVPKFSSPNKQYQY